jgi:phosphomannomutase
MDFGRAYAHLLGPGKRVVLGRDSRPSGDMVASAVSAGLTAGGVDVIDLGIVTTPGTALMAGRCNTDGGVIITASHNPLPYNGIKFLQPSGVGLTASQAEQLKAIWQEGSAPPCVPQTGRLTAEDRTHTMHIDAVCQTVNVPAIAAKRFKVVLDSINGAGCIVTPLLLDRLGCEVVHLNGEPTGQFAHTPEPIEENLTDLCTAVADHGAAVGFAQDPDADRLVLVDETGRFIGEEYTLALCAAHVLAHRPGKLAANLATSRMIDDLAERAGVEVVRAPTGEANVVEAMQREGCIFGGEGNGGVIDPRVVAVRDSLVGMAMVLADLAETGQSLGERVAAIPSYTLVKIKRPCPVGGIDRVIEAVKGHFAGIEDAKLNQSDGLRIDCTDSWLSVRASNTEPIMRIFAEAPTADRAKELAATVKALAEQQLGSTE